jgi:hypothetical protein
VPRWQESCALVCVSAALTRGALTGLQADWNIVKRGWDAHVLGKAPFKFTDPVEAIKSLRVSRLAALLMIHAALTQRSCWSFSCAALLDWPCSSAACCTLPLKQQAAVDANTGGLTVLVCPAPVLSCRVPLTTPSLTSGWTPL